MSKIIRIGILSVVLALGTTYAISLLKFVPYSSSRDRIADVLSFPGGLIAGVAYSEGVHTGAGSPGWATVAFFGNLGVYAAAWFAALWLVKNRLRLLGPE